MLLSRAVAGADAEGLDALEAEPDGVRGAYARVEGGSVRATCTSALLQLHSGDEEAAFRVKCVLATWAVWIATAPEAQLGPKCEEDVVLCSTVRTTPNSRVNYPHILFSVETTFSVTEYATA